MSIQDTIAGQNLFAANSQTALDMIKLQAENMRANQRAGLEVRNQDITREQNQAGNALKSRELTETERDNMTKNALASRGLDIQQQGANRQDYATYVQGDRALSNQERQTDINAQQVANNYELGMRGQDIDIQRAVMQNKILSRNAEIDAGELQLKAQAQALNQAKERSIEQAFAEGGMSAGAKALIASSDPKQAKVGVEMLKFQMELDKNKREENIYQYGELGNQYLGRIASERDPAMQKLIADEWAVQRGLDPSQYNMSNLVMGMKSDAIEASKKSEKDFTSGNYQALAQVFGPNSPEARQAQQVMSAQNTQTIKNTDMGSAIQVAETENLKKRLADEGTQVDKLGQAAQLTRRIAEISKNSPLSDTGVFGQFIEQNSGLATTFENTFNMDLGTKDLPAFQQSQRALASSLKTDSQMSQVEVQELIKSAGQIGQDPNAGDRAANITEAAYLRADAKKYDRLKWIQQNGSEKGFNERVLQFYNERPAVDLGKADAPINRNNIAMPDEYFDPNFKVPKTSNQSVSDALERARQMSPEERRAMIQKLQGGQ